MHTRIFPLFLLVLIAAPLAAQDWKKLPVARVSPEDLASTEEHADLVYATYGDRQLALNLYRPKEAVNPLPAIVCIHGGAWWKGERKNFAHVARALAARGFVAVTISYRLSGEAPFPAQIHDCKAAVRWLRANAEIHGIDPTRIAATGSSAGGHLAALLATSGGVEALEGEGGNPAQSSTIQAAAPMGAQSDLLSERIARRSKDPAAKFYPQFLGGTQQEVPDTYRLASPIHHLDASDPPMIFLTGELDDPSTRADKIRKKMSDFDIPNSLVVIEGAPHPFPSRQPYFDIAIDKIAESFHLYLKSD
jgi:pectinesterase